MHHHYVSFCLALLTSLTVSAQTINLKGTVKNKAGGPIAGASLSLAKQPTLKVTTASDGKFQISTVGTAQLSSMVPNSQFINLNGTRLEISLPSPAPVKVEIFDVKGKLLLKSIQQNASSGYYHLNLAETAYSGNLLLIKASIGKDQVTLRYVPLKNGSHTVKSTVNNSVTSGGSLEKVAATVNDTLNVTAAGFASKSIPITNYVQELDVTLDSASGTIVQLDQVKQTMAGFGINATIMPSNKPLPWNQLFTLEGNNALGLSILRIGMADGGDHRDVPGDWTKAKDLGAKVIGSCWSAPKEWKTNNNVNGGGFLKPEYYDDWATKIADYAKKYGLYAMGVANEADFASGEGAPRTGHYPSMVYTGKQMANFVKVAGPIFKQRAPGVKLIAPEASLWIHVWSNISANGVGMPGAINGGYKSVDPLGCGCWANDITDEAAAKCSDTCKNGGGYDYGHWLAKDTAAWNAVDIMGVHEYETQKAHAWPADVTGGKRTKEIWQTEMSGVMYWPEQGPNLTIENGVAVARWIQSALMVGEASAWCYWWYESYYANDNEGLAIIQGSTQIAKRYYAMGNYSRYIRPGHKIVNITGMDKLPAKVLLTASKDDAGKVVIVAVNETTSEQTVPVTIAGGTVPSSFTPYVTADGTKNWAEGTAVTTSGGVLTAKLEKMSVTTFVSK